MRILRAMIYNNIVLLPRNWSDTPRKYVVYVILSLTHKTLGFNLTRYFILYQYSHVINYVIKVMVNYFKIGNLLIL